MKPSRLSEATPLQLTTAPAMDTLPPSALSAAVPMTQEVWGSPTSSSGGSSKVSYSKLRRPISLLTVPPFARPFSSIVGRVEARAFESYRALPDSPLSISFPWVIATCTAEFPHNPRSRQQQNATDSAIRCLNAPGPRSRRLRQQE
jgi:hypothetical protein